MSVGCRYAITLSVPKGSVRKGIYFDTASPHHTVRLIEGGDGRKDLLLVSGEEHDQGIKPEEYADYFGRSVSEPHPHLYSLSHRVHPAVIAMCFLHSSSCFSQLGLFCGRLHWGTFPFFAS